MKIKIENCSSPGASFTQNTNQVILLIYDWLNENKNQIIPFKEFRMKIEKDKKVNDNNNRNIYPMLKNFGFIDYSKGATIDTNNFFTNTGLAYAKTLQMIDLIEKGAYAESVKEKAISEACEVKSELLCNGLQLLLSKDEVSYRDVLLDFIKFLLTFKKINRLEFACLLYARSSFKEDMFEKLSSILSQYRNKEIDIEVEVSVRNDLELREKTNTSKRNEGLGFLTSYNYFTGLLNQADLIEKEKDYYILLDSKKEKLKRLLGEHYE